MPSPTNDQLSTALLQSFKDGTYPESEEIVAAEFPASSLSLELQIIRDAREEVKNDLRRLSRDSASDVDGWITQARKLHADIDSSRAAAREIIRGHEDGKQLHNKVEDAAAKRDLLKGEIEFNQALVNILGLIQYLDHSFGNIKESLAQDSFLEAISQLDEIQASMNTIGPLSRSRAVSLLRQRAIDLRKYIEQDVDKIWNALVTVDYSKNAVTIVGSSNRMPRMNLLTSISAFEKLGKLPEKIEALVRDVDVTLLTPILSNTSSGQHPRVSIENGSLRVSSHVEVGVNSLLEDIMAIMMALGAMLPSSVGSPLIQTLLPIAVSKLTDSWLLRSLPVAVSDMEHFQTEVGMVREFGDAIASSGWEGKTELAAWAEDLPRVWLSKRREQCLDAVRKLLSSKSKGTEQVERVETQKMSKSDDIFAPNAGGEDWDASWSNEDEDEPTPNPQLSSGEHEDEDVSAWGLEAEANEQNEENGSSERMGKADDDEGDAWGWNEDGGIPETQSPVARRLDDPNQSRSSNALSPDQTPQDREYMLKETYHVTEIPRPLLQLILTQLQDAATLTREQTDLQIAPAAGGLQSLPTLILAMFRATAPSLYAYRDDSSNMLLYNDCMYLAEQLQLISRDESLWDQPGRRANAGSKLLPDITAIERFGKLAYGREMETQRTIIGDLLDGAQGFAHSSEYPFSHECEEAIHSVVDWMRKLNGEWKTVLSNSALQQSLGSLLSTIINKIIVDIEDMNDISEPESRRLTAFCNSISKLEDLFLPESRSVNLGNGAQDPQPLTALYTPNWLKFQYLSTILESSLADIKYLWTSGELSLEFSPEEVTDLIEALFADSDHRRRTIGEIRRTSRGR